MTHEQLEEMKGENNIQTSDRMLIGGRLYGRRTEQDTQLLGQIYTAEKYVILALKNKGNVHILPQKKLDELLTTTAQRLREETIEEVKKILEDNRNETLWGDDDSNEVMEESINAYIIAVKDDLSTLNK